MPTVIAHAYVSCVLHRPLHPPLFPTSKELAAASVAFSKQKGRQTPETRYHRVRAGLELVLGGMIRRRSRWSRWSLRRRYVCPCRLSCVEFELEEGEQTMDTARCAGGGLKGEHGGLAAGDGR